MALVDDIFMPVVADAPDLKAGSVMPAVAHAASSRPGTSEVMSSSTASTPGQGCPVRFSCRLWIVNLAFLRLPGEAAAL